MIPNAEVDQSRPRTEPHVGQPLCLAIPSLPPAQTGEPGAADGRLWRPRRFSGRALMPAGSAAGTALLAALSMVDKVAQLYAVGWYRTGLRDGVLRSRVQ
jgi:hypothetical protein